MKNFTIFILLSFFLVLSGCKKFNDDFIGNWTYKEKGFTSTLNLKKIGDEIVINNNFGDSFSGTFLDKNTLQYNTGIRTITLVLSDNNTILSSPSGRIFKRTN